MRGLKAALFVSTILFGPAAAVAAPAAPITGTLGLGSVGGVNLGGGTASMAIFNAMGAGNVTDGTQSGSFNELAPCSGCVKFGSGTGANTTYTYSASFTTSGTPSDTTYTHLVTSTMPLFALTDGAFKSDFTPTIGTELTIEKVVSRGKTSFTLIAEGLLTLTGFDPTQGSFQLTTNPGGSMFASFSAEADAAPAPLAGAGLLSFGGVGLMALRKRGRRLLGRLSPRLATA